MNREEILSVLKSNMQEVLEGAKGKEISETQSLVSDFGADSLEIVEVVSRTMKQLRVKINRTKLAEPKNIGELVDLFAQSASDQR
jgi:polyketide biosynthesis acyl carrier protein